jgi:hypothetical protein
MAVRAHRLHSAKPLTLSRWFDLNLLKIYIIKQIFYFISGGVVVTMVNRLLLSINLYFSMLLMMLYVFMILLIMMIINV